MLFIGRFTNGWFSISQNPFFDMISLAISHIGGVFFVGHSSNLPACVPDSQTF
jgi:hypothetical protein